MGRYAFVSVAGCRCPLSALPASGTTGTGPKERTNRRRALTPEWGNQYSNKKYLNGQSGYAEIVGSARTRSSLPSFKCGTNFAGTGTTSRGRGVRLKRRRRAFREKLPKPRISTRPPPHKVDANISTMVRTVTSQSPQFSNLGTKTRCQFRASHGGYDLRERSVIVPEVRRPSDLEIFSLQRGEGRTRPSISPWVPIRLGMER